MTKGTRKTNRRLKKTVRKTLGTLFLISAIVVAAIPTEGLRAEEDAVAQAAGHSHNATHTADSGTYTYKVTIARNAKEKEKILPDVIKDIAKFEEIEEILEKKQKKTGIKR